jgi:hypothetical protein
MPKQQKPAKDRGSHDQIKTEISKNRPKSRTKQATGLHQKQRPRLRGQEAGRTESPFHVKIYPRVFVLRTLFFIPGKWKLIFDNIRIFS